jgi:crotonobetainyl-CoA:carnitine CoA-transferase CaiB-like acyl-CoA transferase
VKALKLAAVGGTGQRVAVTPDGEASVTGLDEQPLASLVVVDLTTDVAGPYGTKLLADFGARVVKVEPPGGDPARQRGPYRDDARDPEASGLFLHLNTNKESVVVDLERPEGAKVVRDLVAHADVLVESMTPGLLSRYGLGAQQLLDAHPRLVVCSITPFGQTGPYRDYEMTDIVASAMGGPMNASGLPDREPLKIAGNAVQMYAGATACAATLAAVFRAGTTGRGDHADVAIFEAQNGTLDRRRYYHLAFQYSGTTTPRSPVVGWGRSSLGGRYQTRTGMVSPDRIWPDHLHRVVEVVDDPKLTTLWRAQGMDGLFANADLVDEKLRRWFAARTAREAISAAQRGGWPVVMVNDPDSLLRDEHLVDRGFWVTGNHPVAGALPYGGPPWRIDGNGWQLARTAPLLGQHTDEVLRAVAGYAPDQIESLRLRGIVA